MVDILVPTSSPKIGATVKTVVTESGPQQVIVIPQSLFQQANIGNIQKQQQQRQPVIRISPAATSPSPTARATLKRAIKDESEDEDILKIMEPLDDAKPPVRKRANLDHLTPEEKMMRRKLKNRVAAQNARDKKRVKMDGMEDALRAMKQEMDRIRKENKRLIELNERLLSENQSLKSIGTTIGTNLVMKEEMPPSPESLHSPPHSPAPSHASTSSGSSSSVAESLSDQSIVVGRPSATADHTDSGLQQQDQGRPMAVDRGQQRRAAALLTAATACCLFWTGASATAPKLPPTPSLIPTPPSPSPSKKSSRSSRFLPPKKRTTWIPEAT